jgi:hypothetical protein
MGDRTLNVEFGEALVETDRSREAFDQIINGSLKRPDQSLVAPGFTLLLGVFSFADMVLRTACGWGLLE